MMTKKGQRAIPENVEVFLNRKRIENVVGILNEGRPTNRRPDRGDDLNSDILLQVLITARQYCNRMARSLSLQWIEYF